MNVLNTAWSLLPALIAILLALITKEVYSSLFIGILVGGVLYSGFSLPGVLNHVFVDAIYDDILKASKEYGVERHIGDMVLDDLAAFIGNGTAQ